MLAWRGGVRSAQTLRPLFIPRFRACRADTVSCCNLHANHRVKQYFAFQTENECGVLFFNHISILVNRFTTLFSNILFFNRQIRMWICLYVEILFDVKRH